MATTTLKPPTLEDAISLAALAHQGQVDKAGQPYILHLCRVMLQLETEEGRMVGILHDLIEDTHYSSVYLLDRGYPESVVAAVEALTHCDDLRTYTQYVEDLTHNPLAVQVKLADLRDHLRPERREHIRPYHRERYERALAKLEALTGPREESRG